MISDILSDSVVEIERYRTEPATEACYLSVTAELDSLVAHMTAVRILLDTLPASKHGNVDEYSGRCGDCGAGIPAETGEASL